MLIDLLLVVSWILAIIKGFRQGIILAVFSLAGFIIGIAAAMALSAKVAQQISTSGHINGRWLPAISFFIVFLAVTIFLSLFARMISRTLDLAMLGWANRIAGAGIYVLVVSVIWSVLLFYLRNLQIISENTCEKSVFYPSIASLAPLILDKLGEFIPFLGNLFGDLRKFFEDAGNKINY